MGVLFGDNMQAVQKLNRAVAAFDDDDTAACNIAGEMTGRRGSENIKGERRTSGVWGHRHQKVAERNVHRVESVIAMVLCKQLAKIVRE